MISNLPDDVVHDLLRDLECDSFVHTEVAFCDHCSCASDVNIEVSYDIEDIKHIIEQWEEKRNKYLKSIHKYQPPRRVYNVRHHEDSPFKMPDGSGFFVP